MQANPSEAVDQFIADQTDGDAFTFNACRQFILSFPEIQECFSYKVPFYWSKRNICYLNNSKELGLYIGFLYGKQMLESDHSFGKILKGDLKSVRYYKLTTMREPDYSQLQELIHFSLQLAQSG